jgi:hypothetical protein
MPTRLHGLTFQKTVLFTVADMRTLNHASFTSDKINKNKLGRAHSTHGMYQKSVRNIRKPEGEAPF